MDDNAPSKYKKLTGPTKNGKKKPDYEALALRGLAKPGPKPEIVTECSCSTCRILCDYKPKTTIEECFDYGDSQRELIDLSTESKLSWICANCVCHDKCPGYYYLITEIPFPIHINNPATTYLSKTGFIWEPVSGYDYLLLEHTYKEMKEDWNRGSVDILDKLKCKCECKQCKHNLNTEVLQK